MLAKKLSKTSFIGIGVERKENERIITWKRIATLVGGSPHSAKIVIA